MSRAARLRVVSVEYEGCHGEIIEDRDAASICVVDSFLGIAGRLCAHSWYSLFFAVGRYWSLPE